MLTRSPPSPPPWLYSKRYSVRALTRKVDSPAALALKERGAEVVAADFSDVRLHLRGPPAWITAIHPRLCAYPFAQVESLKVAFAGADALFAVTNFFDSNSAETEKAQLENIIAAAAAAKPRHVVYSGLEDTRVDVPLGTTIPTLGGKYNVEHFDEKGARERASERARRCVRGGIVQM